MKSKPAHKPHRPEPPKRAAVAALDPAPQPSRRWDLLYALLIVALGFLIYSRTLSGPFVFDDSDLMETRSAVRLNDLRIIVTGPRPLTILSFAINLQRTGFQPYWFHLVSVVLHIANALLVWWLARLIAESPGLARWLSAGARRVFALFAPLLFLTSPVLTESVSYISSRSELLKTTFYLLALVVFLRSARAKQPWIAALLVAFLYGCAVASKEDALTLPAAVLLADYFFLAEGNWRGLKRNWPVYSLLGAEMVLGAVIKLRPLLFVPSAGFALKGITWKDYLFTEFRMYFLYLRLLLAPFGLNADYDIQPSRTIFEHGSWLALAGLLALAGAAIYLRRRIALASFGVLFFFVTLAPVSSFVPLLDFAAERRLYLPSIGFFFAAVALVLHWTKNRHWLAPATVILLGIYTVGAYARNGVWVNSLALWQDTVEKSPRKWRVYTWLGFEYSQRRMFTQATEAYRKALELAPPNSRERADILNSLGSTLNNRGMYSEAIPIYEAALKINPEIPILWTNLAIAELRLGRPDGWQHFERAIDLNPLSWEAHLARGNMYLQMGRYDEAIRDYERVLNLVPDNADAQNNLRAARALRQKMNGSRP